MVNVSTKLQLADNSGVIHAQCIRILKKKQQASIGDFLIVAVKSVKPGKKVTKGSIHKSILVRQSSNVKRENGICIKFDNNSIVILNNKNNPIANRIKGPICQELRRTKLMKLISMASIII
jgi:large subunit ribosomal protein L14